MPGATPPPWSVGYDVVAQTVDYDGPEPRYHPVKPDTARRITTSGRTSVAALWGATRWTIGRLAINPGVRIETGSAAAGVNEFRVAPRLAARFTVSPELSVSAAAGRSVQTIQALALSGPSAHPAFHAGQFWVTADHEAPALVTDIVTLGFEQWLGAGFLASATVHGGHSRGMTVPDPAPGPIGRRPPYVVGENEAWGIDAGMRRVAGRWTTSVGYGYGVSEVEAAGLRYPASADRRHRLDILAAAHLTTSLRAGLAFTAMSGAPFTRAISRATAAECTL
ncbi:MAG: TonB-dependent receptor domain-containing protein, partial [Longimicrobiales bacterium]